MGVQKPQVSHDHNTARGRDGAVSWVHGYHKRHHRSNMAWEFIEMVGVPHDFSGNDQLQLLLVQKSGDHSPRCRQTLGK